MHIKPIINVFAAVMISSMSLAANAYSISFNSELYVANSDGQIFVTVNFDFINNPAFGGGFNVIYDPNALEFIRYTQAVYPGGPGNPSWGAASPLGDLVAPGQFLGAGIGTFEFFTGINTAGAIGTFVFNVLDTTGDGGCGATLCLTPVDNNPVFNLLGENITEGTFANGISAANAVPVPAAVWFMLSGLVALAGFGRRTA